MQNIQGNKTQVKVIFRKGSSALVEFIDGELPIRKFVPVNKVVKDFVDNEVLEQGIPYGYPWSEIKLTITGDKFEKEMRNVGLWTAEDVAREPRKLWSALNALLAEDVTNIINVSKKQTKRSM